MKTFTSFSDIETQTHKTAVALGTFDGIHIGHQKIISRAVTLAKQTGGISVVFTFSNHPLSVINPRLCPPQIVTQDYKAELIADLGVDILFSIPFTDELLKLPPENFIELLCRHLNPGDVVVGPNYHYGYKGKGNSESLRHAADNHGFSVHIHPAVYQNGVLVSSTSIRQLILEGEVKKAAVLLGRAPRTSGVVVAGDGRGRGLGFPTANMAIDNLLVVPGNGIYAVYVYIDGKRYAGVANIGINPTFNGTNRHIEIYIINFSKNIYGQNIAVDYLAKLRDEKTFASVDELKSQIHLDIENANKIFK